MTEYLSQFDLLKLRTELSRRTREPLEVANQSGLLSALAAPRQTMFGAELHPTLRDKAATLFFLLIKNHPFDDGNKRIALLALQQFLAENGHAWQPDKSAWQMARAVAQGMPDSEPVCAWLDTVLATPPTGNQV